MHVSSLVMLSSVNQPGGVSWLSGELLHTNIHTKPPKQNKLSSTGVINMPSLWYNQSSVQNKHHRLKVSQTFWKKKANRPHAEHTWGTNVLAFIFLYLLKLLACYYSNTTSTESIQFHCQQTIPFSHRWRSNLLWQTTCGSLCHLLHSSGYRNAWSGLPAANSSAGLSNLN